MIWARRWRLLESSLSWVYSQRQPMIQPSNAHYHKQNILFKCHQENETGMHQDQDQKPFQYFHQTMHPLCLIERLTLGSYVSSVLEGLFSPPMTTILFSSIPTWLMTIILVTCHNTHLRPAAPAGAEVRPADPLSPRGGQVQPLHTCVHLVL